MSQSSWLYLVTHVDCYHGLFMLLPLYCHNQILNNHQWHIILLAVCFYLLLDLVLQEGNQVCQRHLHLFPIFSSWKVDPHLFFFLLTLCHISFNLLCHCLHFGRLNLVLDVLMLILEDPFLYLPLEAVIWSLLDSLHILYQVCHMLS